MDRDGRAAGVLTYFDDSGSMSSMRRYLLVGFVLAAACKGGEKEGGDEAPPAVVNANTIVVTPQAFTETVGAIGVVVGRAGHVATLSAPAPGRIASVDVSTGQAVAAGQPLISLDPATFEAALHSAQTAVDAAQRTYERSQ